MSLITPDFGLFFWMLFAFGILAFVLGKFAWKPILRGLRARENSIAEALSHAESAREEVKKLEARNAEMEAQALADRKRMAEETEAIREQILEEAREQAKAEATRYLASAREMMAHEEEQMRRNLREEVAKVAVEVAEKVLREKLKTQTEQDALLTRILDEVFATKQQA